MLPREDSRRFEEDMRLRLREAIEKPDKVARPELDPAEPQQAIDAILAEQLPPPVVAPPGPWRGERGM